MKKIDKELQILSDLISINNERIERYKNAGYKATDSELKAIFNTLADSSRRNITEINSLIIRKFHDVPASESSGKGGKIFKYWKDARSKFNGTLRNNLFNSYEFGEMVDLASYSMANGEFEEPLFEELILRHEESLRKSLETIKSYRKVYDRQT